eukprot:356112-Chlamydomonas_euryale.AAC.1
MRAARSSPTPQPRRARSRGCRRCASGPPPACARTARHGTRSPAARATAGAGPRPQSAPTARQTPGGPTPPAAAQPRARLPPRPHRESPAAPAAN